jgi:hypothetical protein
MTVKAKFRCSSITKTDQQQEEITMYPVYGKDGSENADFSKWTPSGKLELTINEGTKAYDHFKPGKEYYLSIEEA